MSVSISELSEGYDNQNKPSSNFRKFLYERIVKSNPRRELTTKETKRLVKLEAIVEKLKRGENLQNRQLQMWLSEDEYKQLEYEWQEQLELREELIDKPSDTKEQVNRKNRRMCGLRTYFVLQCVTRDCVNY